MSKETIKAEALRKEAIASLEELILKQHPDRKKASVSVFTFGDARISEIGVSYPTPGGVAGFSYMASEPDCFGVLFAAERYLLSYGTPPYRPEGWDSDIDVAEEDEANFLYLYNKK